MSRLTEEQRTYIDALVEDFEKEIKTLFAEAFTNYENADYADMRALAITDSDSKRTKMFLENVFIPAFAKLNKKHENLCCSLADKKKSVFVIETPHKDNVNKPFKIAVRVRFKEVALSGDCTKKTTIHATNISNYKEISDSFYECVATYSTTNENVKNDRKASDLFLNGLAEALGDPSLINQFNNPDHVTKKIFCNPNVKMIKVF